MKTLLLIRHAKSSWDNEGLSDFERPLNQRGKKDAPRMAKRLKEKLVTPDIVLTSPALRALDTCLEFVKILGFDKVKIKTEKSLYHASEDQLLSVVKSIKDRDRDDDEIALLFGHNPGITEFANSLLNIHIDNIPTCGIVAATLNIESWKDANWGCGTLKFYDFPKNE
jgi:phosphohistidine phosphatase